MKPVVITNPTVYTVPDIDSGSDSEEYVRPPRNFEPYRTEEEERNLIKLGCVYNVLDEHRKLYSQCVPDNYNKESHLKWEQHQAKVLETNIAIIEAENKKRADERKILEEEFKKLVLEGEERKKRLDIELEKELEEESINVERSIEYERRRIETESAKVEKEKKDLKEKEEQKALVEQKKKENEQIKEMQESSATNAKGYEQYKKYLAKIEAYQLQIRPKLQDKAFNNACFMKKNGVRRILSQLTIGNSYIFKKFQEVHTKFMEIKQESSDVYEVTLNYFAKAMVNQARQDIEAKPHTAYFLARFAYLLCSAIPEFKDYLMGRLLKRCPYLIPQFHDGDASLSDAEIRSRLRYIYKDKQTKTLETFLQHAEGHKSYVMFYGALCQAIPEPGEPENPFSIKDAWIYLARICNMPVRTITSFLIIGLLETAGKRLLEAYPNQTPKFFRLIKQSIVPLLPADTDSGAASAVSRLNIFLDTYFEKGIVLVTSENPP